MDDDVRARLAALEMTDYLFFAALAEMEPAIAQRLLTRLGQWAQGQPDRVQALLATRIALRQSYVDAELSRRTEPPAPARR